MAPCVRTRISGYEFACRQILHLKLKMTFGQMLANIYSSVADTDGSQTEILAIAADYRSYDEFSDFLRSFLADFKYVVCGYGEHLSVRNHPCWVYTLKVFLRWWWWQSLVFHCHCMFFFFCLPLAFAIHLGGWAHNCWFHGQIRNRRERRYKETTSWWWDWK